MTLTVLTDTDVKELLDNLTLNDVEKLQDSLRKSLHEYSTGNQEDDCCSTNQPDRTVMQQNGKTTLFMPSTSSLGIGMKVVTLVAPTAKAPQPTSASADTTPRGALTIMSNDGRPTGFVNAEEITAFRTALASSLLLSRRTRLKNIAVFGAGKQAFWHIRLALLLRGHTIKHIYIINRSFSERSRMMVRRFWEVDSDVKEREGWHETKFAMLSPQYGEYDRLVKEQLRSADAIITTVPSTKPLFDHTILTNTEGRKKGRLVIAIGSYKPDMIEVPKELLHQATKVSHDHRHFHKHAVEGGVVVVDTLTGCLKEAGEIIQSGLSPMQLVEIGELVMLDGQFALCGAEQESSPEASLHRLSLDVSAGSSMASVMREDSERSSRKSSISKHSRQSSLSSLGRKSRSSSVDSKKTMDSKKTAKKDDHMTRWLSDGNVIYKSVGMGLMDLVVGGDLVALAREKKVGTTIPSF